jgi:hypothetical protein
VPCPRNSRYIAEVSWLFFKTRKGPISESYGSSEQRGKTATGPGPRGCGENGPAAALLVGHVSIQICSLLPPCWRPISIATIYLLFPGKGTTVSSHIAGHMHPTYETTHWPALQVSRGSFGRKGGLNRNALALGIFGSQKKVHSNVHFFLSRSLHA